MFFIKIKNGRTLLVRPLFAIDTFFGQSRMMPSKIELLGRLDVVLVLFDHLLDHLTADRTCLTGGKIAVVAVVKIDADFICRFHFELVESGLRFGNKILISCHFD